MERIDKKVHGESLTRVPKQLREGAHRQKDPVRIVAQLGKAELPIEHQSGLILRVCDHGERSNLRRLLVRPGQSIHEKEVHDPRSQPRVFVVDGEGR